METLLTAAGALAALGGLAGLALSFLHARLKADPGDDVERLNALLPQTQCGQCGYPGCRPYAAAVVAGRAGIDLCPPGGAATRQALARALGQMPLSSAPPAPPERPWIARIDESSCVGCFRCVEVCPVDAIIGASRHTHTVLAADCTGCELCIPACPVDCITLEPPTALIARHD